MLKYFVVLLCSAVLASGAMLLKNYDNRDLHGWVMSEKYDGVRAIWDGKKLLSRQNKAFCTPKSFLAQLPPFALDGELWSKRGDFENISSIVSRCDDDWNTIKYMVFDAPENNGTLSDRLAPLKDFLAKNHAPNIKIIEQKPILKSADAFEFLDEITAGGGEGIVVRDPNAPYTHTRSDKILKLKKFKDSECEVLEIIPRKDDIKAIGSVICKDVKSKIVFKIGSGFGDTKLQKGDIITYKYQNLTKNKKPRFASFLRKVM